jgi:hypothetical protein
MRLRALAPVGLGRRPNAGGLFEAQFHRLRSRRGAKKALVAVAAAMLTAIYHMLKDGTACHDLGHDHLACRAKQAQTPPPRRPPPAPCLCSRDQPLGHLNHRMFLVRVRLNAGSRQYGNRQVIDQSK